MSRRVLYDASPMLDNAKTGVGYYVHGLIKSLQDTHADQVELTGYYFNFLHRREKKPPAASGRFHEIWLMPGKLLSLGRRLGIQPALETFLKIPKAADLVLYTNYVALPLRHKRKMALVIYDLGFLDVPEYTQSVNLKYLQRFCPPSIRRADLIITISEFTKQRLEYHFPNLKAAVVVTPIPPVEKTAERVVLPARLSDMGIIQGKYLLYVGTIEPRKNLENLLKAYSQLPEKLQSEYSLVLTGGRGWKDEAILELLTELQAKGLRIVQTGYVSDKEKSALYSNATSFVLPSHYEGFGMPILEAMQYELPCLLSDIPVFHEVAGPAAHYFDKDDVGDIAKKLAAVLSDAKVRTQLSEAASTRLSAFSWQDNADLVYEAIEKIA